LVFEGQERENLELRLCFFVYFSRFYFYAISGCVTTLLLFTLSNIALPGTSSFIREFLILVGVLKLNTSVALLGAFGLVLVGTYSLYLF
jgi:NADH:ubiquinone oxidoreductase subunit 4 (subunit M)